MKYLSTEYDEELNNIPHYINYPEMRPWIGVNYTHEKVKLLTVGESHYLTMDSKYHLNPEDWYDGVLTSDKEDIGGINTRNVIDRGTATKWKKKSYVIFKNTEDALFSSQLFSDKPDSAYYNIAFMNYFQRPAQVTGKSIRLETMDENIAKEVFLKVVDCINPTAIIFTSSLAYKSAKRSGTLKSLESKKIPFTRSPHPATSWWNRKSKKYKNKTGKDHFISFVNEQVK